ncbi:MAG: CPBP family intramembrane metalloprotease [Clostridia bacterium]|nr:CPBP family intramembrane metalloprotease [Clostridia bacterium]
MKKLWRMICGPIFYIAVYPISQMAALLLAVLTGALINADGINFGYNNDIYALLGEAVRFSARNVHIVLLASMLFAFTLCLVFIHSRHERLREIVLRRKISIISGAAVIAAALGARLLVSAYMLAADSTAQIPQTLIQYKEQLFFIGVLFAPVIEEFIYRALLVRELNKMMPRAAAILVSAAAFALSHMMLYQAVYTVFLGILLAVVYSRLKSIYASVALHLTFNLSAVAETTFLGVWGNAFIGMLLVIIAMAVILNRRLTYTGATSF